MLIKEFNIYKDGGTIEVRTTKGIFCFDNRLCSESKNEMFKGYPKNDNSNMLIDAEDLKQEIVESLKTFDDKFHQEQITDFIKNNSL